MASRARLTARSARAASLVAAGLAAAGVVVGPSLTVVASPGTEVENGAPVAPGARPRARAQRRSPRPHRWTSIPC